MQLSAGVPAAGPETLTDFTEPVESHVTVAEDGPFWPDTQDLAALSRDATAA